MTSDELAKAALRLSGESTGLLDQWIRNVDDGSGKSGEKEGTPDLKELAAFLTCVKRTLEIARIAEALDGGEGGGDGGSMDLESIRRSLFEED